MMAATLQPSGDLTIYSVGTLAPQWGDALRDSSGIVLDLSGVSDVDTAGVQLLLHVHREAQRAGKPCELQHVPPALAEWLALLGLKHAFDLPGDSR